MMNDVPLTRRCQWSQGGMKMKMKYVFDTDTPLVEFSNKDFHETKEISEI